MESLYLDKKQVAELIGVGYRTVFRIIDADDTFPNPVALPGQSRPRWWRDDVIRWARAKRRAHGKQEENEETTAPVAG